jgi:hypothetical protein
MRVRLTLDNDMVVRECHVDMAEIPFTYCAGASANAGGLVGATVGPGWRQAVGAAMKGIQGCTHVREVLVKKAQASPRAVSLLECRIVTVGYEVLIKHPPMSMSENV